MPLARHDDFFTIMLSHATLFLLTCLLRGMTLNERLSVKTLSISTHMPLARHDNFCLTIEGNFSYFYSHASCEAWHFYMSICFYSKNFYSHASCEAWPQRSNLQEKISDFYSHASCEAWHRNISTYRRSIKFLLTCLLRGMTQRP